MATTEPLNPDLEAGNGAALAAAGVNLPPEPELKGPLKPVADMTPVEYAAGGVAIAAVVTSLIAIVLENSAVVVVAGLLSSIMGPYAYWQQTRLTDIRTLKETAAAVKVEVDKLDAENKRLKGNITTLGETIQDLDDVEKALEEISALQGDSLAKFEAQVQQNKDFLAHMKQGNQRAVAQNLFDLIIRGDTDGDKVFSEVEVNKIIASLEKIGGVHVKHDKFQEALVGKGEDAVFNLLFDVSKQDIPEEEKIFTFTEQ